MDLVAESRKSPLPTGRKEVPIPSRRDALEETHIGASDTAVKDEERDEAKSGEGRKERDRQSCGYPDPMAHAVRGTDRWNRF